MEKQTIMGLLSVYSFAVYGDWVYVTIYIYMYIVTPRNIEKPFILILQQDPTNFCYIYIYIHVYVCIYIYIMLFMQLYNKWSIFGLGWFFNVIDDSLCFQLCHIYISSPASHIYSWFYHTLFGLWPVVNYSLVAWELFTVFVPSFESKSRRFLHEPIPESSSLKLLRPIIDFIFSCWKSQKSSISCC